MISNGTSKFQEVGQDQTSAYMSAGAYAAASASS